MKKAKQNPLHTHPELQLIINSKNKKASFFQYVIIDFKKDFKVLTTYEKLTPSKLYQFYILNNLNPQSDFMWIFIDKKGGYINEYGEPTVSNYDLRPDNAFWRKTDFVKALKSDVLKVFVIQKRSDLKRSKYNNFEYSNIYRLSRFRKSKKNNYYHSLYFKQNYYISSTYMDKSGFNLYYYKQELNNRLSTYKKSKH